MSIRKFFPEPIPRDILTEIVRTAMRSPSYRNTQPWEIAIVSGEKKEALSRDLVRLIEQKSPSRAQFREPLPWPNHIDRRIGENVRRRAETVGLDLKDPNYGVRSRTNNARFYGAPHGVFFFQDDTLTEWSILDMGMFVQTFMLAANARGIGTVPQAFLTDYPDVIRSHLGIPDHKRILLGMSAGYPDRDDRMNGYHSGRAEIEEILHWIE
jgi:nitroreductase